jgi:hypothetical protein
MKLLVLVLPLFLGGCGGAHYQPDHKMIWNSWSNAGATKSVDLTSVKLGNTSQVTITFSDGAKCVCDAEFNGAPGGGEYELSMCLYHSGGAGDPGCAGLNGAGTYSNISGTLNLCVNSTCSEYH